MSKNKLVLSGISGLAVTLLGCTSAFAAPIQLTQAPTAQELNMAHQDVQSGHVQKAVPLMSPTAQTSNTLQSASLSTIYGPFSFSAVSYSGLSSNQFTVNTSSVRIDSTAYESNYYDSGQYSYTLYQDSFWGATDKGSWAYPYGQYSPGDSASGYWTGLTPGSYNFVITAPSGRYVSGNGTVYDY